MRTLLLILSVNPWFLTAYGIDLIQIGPEEILACPGDSVSFMCISESDALGWLEDGDAYLFDSPTSSVIMGLNFIFKLVNVSGSTFVSIASDPNISAADNRKEIGCFDDDIQVFQTILVRVQPANCQGTVTCITRPSSGISSLTVISVSLVAPSGQSCVEGYEFVFGNISKIVGLDWPAANFTVDKNLGFEYVNQQIFTLNAENVRGAQPCTFSITEPSAILQVTCHQECNQTTMDITVILDWDRPSLPEDNCLDASHLWWMYRIQVLNFVPSVYETSQTNLTISGFPSSGEYSIMITPTLPDLGLSGPPLNSTIVLNQTCPPLSNTTEPPSICNSDAVAVVALGAALVLLALIIIVIQVLVIRWTRQKRKALSFHIPLSGHGQFELQSSDHDQQLLEERNKERKQLEEKEELVCKLEEKEKMIHSLRNELASALASTATTSPSVPVATLDKLQDSSHGSKDVVQDEEDGDEEFYTNTTDEGKGRPESVPLLGISRFHQLTEKEMALDKKDQKPSATCPASFQ